MRQSNFDAFDKVSYSSKFVYGRLHRYEINGKKSAKIYVSDSLNYCWTRFVACKELSHLLIDTNSKSYTNDPLGLIQCLVNFTPPADSQSDLASEHLATVAATELLIPWSCRDDIRHRISKGENYYNIALQYKVPEKVIDYWHTEKYQKVVGDAWKDI